MKTLIVLNDGVLEVQIDGQSLQLGKEAELLIRGMVEGMSNAVKNN